MASTASHAHAGVNPNRPLTGGEYPTNAALGGTNTMPGANDNERDDINSLTQSLQNMAVTENNGHPLSRGASMGAINPSSYTNLGHAIPTSYWGPHTSLAMAGYPGFGQGPAAQSASMYSPAAAHYVARNYPQGFDNMPLSPWSIQGHGGELPTLITPRRESLSSLENDTPSTPGFPSYHPAMTQSGVAILSRSPSGTYTTSTPSPLHMLAQYGINAAKIPDAEAISPRLQVLVSREPAIPPAIPAPSSPLKPLDRALENTRGETNVYIRGLMPETTDEMLAIWGRRFGDIKSSKSIIDHSTGRCKGFGFVRYHNYADAEDCIRGFHHLGYEVSFARESFYSKLKAIADDLNTNLYVSNLPKGMNEHELASIFAPRKVCSARILRTNNGIGRGVGFARFENRQDCELVIRDFNNKTITSHGGEHTIQIRFADTQEQKSLKQTTAAARQFRSDEYEYATRAHRNGWFQPDSPSPLQTQFSGQENVVPGSNDFKNFLGHAVGFGHRAQNHSDPNGWRGAPLRSPLSMMSANANIGRGAMSINSTPLAKARTDSLHEGGVTLPTEGNGHLKGQAEVSPTRNGTSNVDK